MQVRAARDDDLPALTRIWFDGWHDAHDGIVPPPLVALRTHASFADRLRAELPGVLVVADGHAVVGFTVVRGAEVFQFYVDRPARGTGAASFLMRATQEAMAARGISNAWLACAVGNVRAARFYEKCGWIRTATVVIESETSEGSFPIRVWRYDKRLR